MKTASLPAVRITPELHDRAQGELREGESLSSFVEEAVRRNIERREAERAFLERGLESLAKARESGRYHSSDSVLRELRADLEAARRRRRQPANR